MSASTTASMDAQPPEVSIVVPTCNRRDLVLQCARAVAAQSHRAFELIIIDDGSTDDTVSALRDFARESPGLRLQLIENGTNLGANPSRNRGIRAARGAFVAFLDSDCEPQPAWLEHILKPFADPEVAAVTGLVEDPAPRNIYELAFKGTHRMPRSREAHRLILGNLCVRRDVLVRFMLDEDRAAPTQSPDGSPDIAVSGRGDEEGLYLLLKAAGYKQFIAHDAVVLHHHHYDRCSFFRQAYRGGCSAARLVHKFRLPHRLDMLPFIFAYGSLVLVIGPALLWSHWLLLVPAFFMFAALAAITYNDLARKGKAPVETIVSFPMLLAYYHVRLWGYATEFVRIRLGRSKIQPVGIKTMKP